MIVTLFTGVAPLQWVGHSTLFVFVDVPKSHLYNDFWRQPMSCEFLCLVRGPYHGPRDHFTGEVRSEYTCLPSLSPLRRRVLRAAGSSLFVEYTSPLALFVAPSNQARKSIYTNQPRRMSVIDLIPRCISQTTSLSLSPPIPLGL